MKDPRACPTCGLWQRTAWAAVICLDPAHAAERAAPTAEGPDDGHTFEITFRSRGSYAVKDGPHHDADWWGDPVSIQLRGWSLRDALTKAVMTPLEQWGWPEESDDPSA